MAILNDRVSAKIDATEMGGVGFYFRERLAEGPENLGAAVKTYARITVPAGSAMGYHQHVGDFEIYYILEGEGEYNDNGNPVPARPGDVFLCRDGEWHSIKNVGDADLAFVALIVKSDVA
jgi:quercetin dioxygenase-like cupin family protein